MTYIENDILFSEPSHPNGYTCKRCKQGNLIWGCKDDEWHLYDRNHKPHTCETKEGK